MAQWVMGHLVTYKALHNVWSGYLRDCLSPIKSTCSIKSGRKGRSNPRRNVIRGCVVFNLKLPSLNNTDLEQRQLFKEFQNNCRYDPYGSLERCLLGSILEKVCHLGPNRWYCLIEGTLSTATLPNLTWQAETVSPSNNIFFLWIKRQAWHVFWYKSSG